LFALAAILASVDPCRVHYRRKSVLWHGLDWPNLQRAIKEADLGSYPDEEVEAVMTGIARWREQNPNKALPGAAVGRWLDVSRIECDELRLKVITAADETREERDERRKAKKREVERERTRAKRAGTHIPRSQYLAQAQRKRDFCRAHGISDRTLRRWIRKRDSRVRSLLEDDIDIHISQQTSDIVFACSPRRRVQRDSTAKPSATALACLRHIGFRALETGYSNGFPKRLV
jgi:hypothetical protein